MYTRKLTQQRPNTGVEFYKPESNVIKIIEDNDGIFEQVTSEDGLTNTMSITFTDEVYVDTYGLDNLERNTQIRNDMKKRQKYCNDNSIIYNIDDPWKKYSPNPYYL